MHYANKVIGCILVVTALPLVAGRVKLMGLAPENGQERFLDSEGPLGVKTWVAPVNFI